MANEPNYVGEPNRTNTEHPSYGSNFSEDEWDDIVEDNDWAEDEGMDDDFGY